jgi:methylglutaconyl-CoA hydratase
MSKTVLSQIDADGNATVLLNRPDVHNAFDPEMVEALTATLKKLDADSGVRAVVLTGAGKSFSAGADIGHMKKSARATRAQNLEDARGIARMLLALYTMKKPTIACVRGAVRGGGVGLVAACDIAIADFTATFRLSEVRLGILPAAISPYVIAAIGERVARRYMLSGEEFDCAEAYRIGLLHEISPEPELSGTVGRMLAQLYLGGPEAIVAIKRLIPDIARSDVDAAVVEKTAQTLADLRVTPEAQEGLSAFLEKRKARWVEPPAPATKKPAGKRPR